MADDEAAVLAGAKKLPLGEQLTHANWKVRSQALEGINEACGRAFSSEDPVFAEAGVRSSAHTGQPAAIVFLTLPYSSQDPCCRRLWVMPMPT